MRFSIKKRVKEQSLKVTERQLRYAVVAMLDATGGDQEWVKDVYFLAQYQWDQVNNNE